MKRILLITTLLVSFIVPGSMAEGIPFSRIKDNNEKYTLKEAQKFYSDPVNYKLLLSLAYVLKETARQDGWLKFLPNEEVSPEYALKLLGSMKEKTASWSSGDISMYAKGNNGNLIVSVDRISFMNRKKQISGPETVFVLDAESVIGVQAPERMFISAWCLNTIFDRRKNSVSGIYPGNTPTPNLSQPADSNIRTQTVTYLSGSTESQINFGTNPYSYLDDCRCIVVPVRRYYSSCGCYR